MKMTDDTVNESYAATPSSGCPSSSGRTNHRPPELQLRMGAPYSHDVVCLANGIVFQQSIQSSNQILPSTALAVQSLMMHNAKVSTFLPFSNNFSNFYTSVETIHFYPSFHFHVFLGNE
jgi:hypothetical protein